jgi:hypothetical protein
LLLSRITVFSVIGILSVEQFGCSVTVTVALSLAHTIASSTLSDEVSTNKEL